MYSLNHMQGSETRFGVTCGFQVNHPRLCNERIYFPFSDMMIYREGRYEVVIWIVLTHQNSVYRIQAKRFTVEVIIDEAPIKGPCKLPCCLGCQRHRFLTTCILARHERHIAHVLRGCPQWYMFNMNGRYADEWSRAEQECDEQGW